MAAAAGGRPKKSDQFAHLDNAKLGWHHLKAVLISGVGFFTDAYDIFVIGQALPMM
jgi:MFS transporter, PHS family, inorganic phosphate transporter